MAPRISVRTEPYYDAAQLLTHEILGPRVSAADRLVAELGDCWQMAGSDPGGTEWASAYDAAAGSAITATQDLLTATFRVGLLLEQTGRNHERAEAASTSGAAVPDPWIADPSWQSHLPVPPAAAGGEVPTPFGWNLVQHWVGYLWPNGHQDRLHRAARAWRAGAAALVDAEERFWQPSGHIETIDSPEVPDALATLEALRLHYDDVARAHRALGDACDALAHHIDQMHAAVADALFELIEWTAAIEVAGGILSFFTFGLAEAPTQAEVLARCLATAEKIKNLYESYRVAVAVWLDSLPTVADAAETIRLALAPLTTARLGYAGVLEVRSVAGLDRALVMQARAEKNLADAAKVERVESTVTKADSPIWKSFKPFRGKTKTNGLTGKDRRYYEWDHRHNDIEVYDSNRLHLGSMDPVTGEMTKPPLNRMLDK